MNDIRGEIDEIFDYHNAKIQNQFDATLHHTKGLVNELHDQMKEELRLDLDKLDSRFLKFIEEERKIRSEEDSEILKQVNTVKNMLLETIHTKIESTQALARALVSEEAAERARAIDHVLKTLNARINSVEESLKKLITTLIEELRGELNDKVRQLEIKLEEHRLWTIKELNKVVDDFEQYVSHDTVRHYLLELQLQTESRLTVNLALYSLSVYCF